MMGNEVVAPAKRSICATDASHDSRERGTPPTRVIPASRTWHPAQSRMKRRLIEPSGRSASHAEAGAEVSAGATPSDVIGWAVPKANRAPAQIDSAARSGAAERAV